VPVGEDPLVGAGFGGEFEENVFVDKRLEGEEIATVCEDPPMLPIVSVEAVSPVFPVFPVFPLCVPVTPCVVVWVGFETGGVVPGG